jgi:hypothetical protein
VETEQELYCAMSFFSRLFGKKPVSTNHSENEQAVIVYLDGTGLPDEIYEKYDSSTIEDRLIEVIDHDGLGEFDGNEFGPAETALYMYGPDADRLFAGIEGTLRGYPLCQGARVVIRYGGPGSNEKEVRL